MLLYFVHGIGFYLLYCLPKQDKCRAVIKRRGPGISPSYYERLPRLLSKENERKIEPKEIPSCLIPRPLVVFTRQIEILVTTLRWPPTNHRNYKTLLVKLIVMFTAPALK